MYIVNSMKTQYFCVDMYSALSTMFIYQLGWVQKTCLVMVTVCEDPYKSKHAYFY